MFKRILFGAAVAAFSAGIATSAVRVKLASPPVAPSSWGLDISEIERDASMKGWRPSTRCISGILASSTFSLRPGWRHTSPRAWIPSQRKSRFEGWPIALWRRLSCADKGSEAEDVGPALSCPSPALPRANLPSSYLTLEIGR